MENNQEINVNPDNTLKVWVEPTLSKYNKMDFIKSAPPIRDAFGEDGTYIDPS